MEATDGGWKRMPLGDHLEELRSRALASVVAVGLAFVLCFLFYRPILGAFLAPMERALRNLGLDPGKHLIFNTGFEGIMAAMKASIIAALFASSPIVLWQLWAFVAAGLYPHERRAIFVLFPVSVGLFFLGLLFSYFVLIPYGTEFLVGFARDLASPQIRLEWCLSFFLWMALLMGLAFEFPLVLYGLARVGIVSAADLASRRKMAVLGIVVLAAVLTPSPDMVTQVLLAGPLWILYEVGILWVRLGDPATPAAERARARRSALVVIAVLLALSAAAAAFGTSAWTAAKDRWLGMRLGRKDPAARAAAVRLTAGLPPGRALPHLREGIADADPGVRAAAADALAGLPAAAWGEAAPVLEAALRDPEPRVRLRAAIPFARRKDRRALPVLVDLLDAPETFPEALKSLNEATGEDLERGLLRERWRRWLETTGKEWGGGEPPGHIPR